MAYKTITGFQDMGLLKVIDRAGFRNIEVPKVKEKDSGSSTGILLYGSSLRWGSPYLS